MLLFSLLDLCDLRFLCFRRLRELADESDELLLLPLLLLELLDDDDDDLLLRLECLCLDSRERCLDDDLCFLEDLSRLGERSSRESSRPRNLSPLFRDLSSACLSFSLEGAELAAARPPDGPASLIDINALQDRVYTNEDRHSLSRQPKHSRSNMDCY